jgi:protein MPE1
MGIIPRNSSIIIRRIPVPDAKKRGIAAGTNKYNTDDLHMGVPTVMGLGNTMRPTYGRNQKGTTELVPVSHSLSVFSSNNGSSGIPGLQSGTSGIPGLSNLNDGDFEAEGGDNFNEEDRIKAFMQENTNYWQATQEKMAGYIFLPFL